MRVKTDNQLVEPVVINVNLDVICNNAITAKAETLPTVEILHDGITAKDITN